MQLQLVIEHEHKVSTTSLLVAQKFEKEHKTVLRTIQNLDCTMDFREHNFVLSSYKSMQNRDLPMFIISKDGFAMLMMAFTGPAAAKFREEYIEQFNRMEAVIRLGETRTLIPVYSQRVLSEPTLSCSDDYWNIFDASHNIMLFIEKHIGCINKYDIADGSIGIRWSQFRKGKHWAVESSTYTHEYDDNRGPRECKCYSHAEAGYFKEWLRDTYKQQYLLTYLTAKYADDPVMLDKVQSTLPKLLGNGD